MCAGTSLLNIHLKVECSVYFPDLVSVLYTSLILICPSSQKYRKFLHFPTASHNLIFFMSDWFLPSNIFFLLLQPLLWFRCSTRLINFNSICCCFYFINIMPTHNMIQQQLSSLEDVLLPFPLTYTPWHSIESCHLPIGPCLPDNSD